MTERDHVVAADGCRGPDPGVGDRAVAQGFCERLTGLHETCSYKEYRYGVSDRGASVRIPWQVAKDHKGYIEDRRPNANVDPYVSTRLILETVCGAAMRKRSAGSGARQAVPA